MEAPVPMDLPPGSRGHLRVASLGGGRDGGCGAWPWCLDSAPSGGPEGLSPPAILFTSCITVSCYFQAPKTDTHKSYPSPQLWKK